MYCHALEEFSKENPHLELDTTPGRGELRFIVKDEYKKGITDEENTDFTLSDYEKLFDILIRFYTEKQLEEIWGILQEYDAKILKLKNK